MQCQNLAVLSWEPDTKVGWESHEWTARTWPLWPGLDTRVNIPNDTVDNTNDTVNNTNDSINNNDSTNNIITNNIITNDTFKNTPTHTTTNNNNPPIKTPQHQLPAHMAASLELVAVSDRRSCSSPAPPDTSRAPSCRRRAL